MSLQPTVFPVVRPDDRSLPPTGQPLTVVSEASVGQAAYGGGGGGGGGANPSVSSLTVNATGSIELKWNDATGQAGNPALLQLDCNNSGNDAEIFSMLTTNYLPPGITTFGQPAELALLQKTNGTYVSDAGGLTLRGLNLINFSAVPGQFGGSILADSGSILMTSPNSVIVSAPTTISSIFVSSVNGQPVGGGGGSVPPNLVTSSIQALSGGDDLVFEGQNGIIVCDQNGDGQALILQQSPVNAEMRLVNGSSVLKIGGQAGQSEVPVSISSLTVGDINGAPYPPPAANVNSSTFSTFVGLSSINSGAPAGLTVVGELVVTNTIGCSALSTISITSIVPGGNVVVPLIQSSNLNVSSINGAAYPPAGGGGVFSTLYESNSTIICASGGTTSLLQFPVVNGQGYNCSWQVGVSGFNAEVINAGENIIGLLSVDGGTTSIAGNVTLAAVSTNAALGFDQLQVGGCLNFKGGANSNVRLEVYNATNSTITVNLGESYLVSY